MNVVYHFGDSYGTTDKKSKHFVQLLSEDKGYIYNSEGVEGGCSNEEIFNKLLNLIYDFKDGDILFFNFSFLTRGTYWDIDEKKIITTNRIYNDMGRIYNEKIDGYNPLNNKEYVVGVITYHSEHTEDYSRKLFHKFDIIFKQLIERNISTYYIFNIHDYSYTNELLSYGVNIQFPGGFIPWLYENGYHNHEEMHYSIGAQPNIYNYLKPFII